MTMIEKVARAICRTAVEASTPNALPSAKEDMVARYWPNHVANARAALEALLEPDDEMAEAAWTDTKRPTPEERMAMELCDNHTAFVIKSKRRFTAMIQSALSHNPGEEG